MGSVVGSLSCVMQHEVQPSSEPSGTGDFSLGVNMASDSIPYNSFR